MNCLKCGTELNENDLFCSVCGESTRKPEENDTCLESTSDMNSFQEQTDEVSTDNSACGVDEKEMGSMCDVVCVEGPKKEKKIYPYIIGGVSGLLVLFIIIGGIAGYFLIGHMGKQNLKKELLRDWSRVEKTDSDYYTLELDFFEDTIDYNFKSTYLNDMITDYSYKVISKDKVKIDNREYKIEFNDEKTMMTISPALTESAEFEYWFNFE